MKESKSQQPTKNKHIDFGSMAASVEEARHYLPFSIYVKVAVQEKLIRDGYLKDSSNIEQEEK